MLSTEDSTLSSSSKFSVLLAFSINDMGTDLSDSMIQFKNYLYFLSPLYVSMLHMVLSTEDSTSYSKFPVLWALTINNGIYSLIGFNGQV